MLTSAQIRRLQVVTNLIHRYYSSESRTWSKGQMCYRLEMLEDGSVMLFANNISGGEWYETTYRCEVSVQKKGGIRYYSGTMSPKLVLPVVPRRCNYENPFKKS